MKFCTAAQMRRLDEKTITECGIPGVVLMENAGRGAAQLACSWIGGLSGKTVTVVAGKGNNGGDGYVMARIFHGWGAKVCTYLLGEIGGVSGDARINLDVALKTGRTHQIRVHCSAMGHPIVGDAVYGARRNRKIKAVKDHVSNVLKAVPRQMLHAAGLTFAHPGTQAKVSFESPMPQDFQAVLTALRRTLME